jgi:hypothetical protein
MPSDAAPDAEGGGSGATYPPCPTCDSVDQVQPFLALAGLSPSVRYFRCAHCGLVWTTGDDEITV